MCIIGREVNDVKNEPDSFVWLLFLNYSVLNVWHLSFFYIFAMTMENTKGKYWTKIAIMAVIPAVLVGIIYLSTLRPTIDLLENKSELFVQVDSMSGGNSKCKINKSDDGVDMTFTLGSSITYPYVALEVHHPDFSPFPVDDYLIETVVESDEDLRLSFRLQEELDFGVKGKAYPIAVYSFLSKKGRFEVSSHIDEAKIPEWWYAQYPQWSSIEKLRYENVNIIRLYADNSNEKDVEHKIKVKSLRLVPNTDNACLNNAIKMMFAFWLILAIVALYLRRNNEKKEESENEAQEPQQQQVVYVPYEKLETEKETTNLKEEILTFIGKNYPNPELKLADIAKALSMTEDKTSEEIRIATGKSFKAYLNTIRIEESKRLLKETTMQISEIAFSVGYNNVQHFNRVFKESVGVAPGAFRDGASGEDVKVES